MAESKYQLAVLHLPDLKFISRLDMTEHHLPIDITWVDNTRLVMGVGRETAFSEAPSPTGDIIAVDIDGKNKRVLYSDRARGTLGAQQNILKIPIGFGSISGTPDKANGHFYLTVNPAPESGGTDDKPTRLCFSTSMQAMETSMKSLRYALMAMTSSCTMVLLAMRSDQTIT